MVMLEPRDQTEVSGRRVSAAADTAAPSLVSGSRSVVSMSNVINANRAPVSWLTSALMSVRTPSRRGLASP